ncbi:MAG: methanogenesis marker 17 protein [Methanobacteriaceae archaeon]|jgi:putative methanogenesis marker protein 17|nr:methanogenesis marker 17 protein [Methanobacteriaceae archaeon]
MLVECYDEKGAEVYDMIIRQIFQDLILGPSVDDLRAFADPDQVVFILAIKMKKTAGNIFMHDAASLNYDKAENKTIITVDNENFLPNILKKLWKNFSRDEIYQPDRFTIILDGDQMNINDLIIDNSQANLRRRLYDAVFRILPEGFRIIKDLSKGDIIAVIATDELIMDSWIEKANEFIEELS